MDIAKELSKDRKALHRIKLSRTNAAYKMQYGVSCCIEKKLVLTLQRTFISLNIDEATSKTLHKVLKILVSYFWEENQQVVMAHLASVTLPSVGTQAIYNALVVLFQGKKTPWSNCRAIFVDSCNVMRGSKSGLEQRIRGTVNPNLLNIDGETCHRIHNSCRKFTSLFNHYLEQLLCNLYTYFKSSENYGEYMNDISFYIGLTYLTRWLTIHDIAIQTENNIDVFAQFYFEFLSK